MQRLTLISVVTPPGAKRKKGLYRCTCGVEKIVDVYHVNSGHTKSCGCYRRDLMSEKQTVHGRYYDPEFACWKAMIARCLGKGAGAAWYRSVFVCERWLRSYENFLADVGPRPSPQHSLDRIDHNGDYEPGNVRWADRNTQSRNTKNHCTNTTGHRGVSWSKAKGKWRAAIYVNNRQHHVGYFNELADAVSARQEAERRLWAR